MRQPNLQSFFLTTTCAAIIATIAGVIAHGQTTSVTAAPTSVELRDGTGARYGVDGNPLVSRSSGTASASGALPPVVSSTVTAGSLVLKAAAGNLYDLYAVSVASGALVTVDAASAPSAGAITPVDCLPLPGGTYASLSYLAMPESFSNGIVALISTGTFPGSCTTYTPGSGFIHGRVK